MTAQKRIKSRVADSTQKFTEVLDIAEDIVLLHGGSACLTIEVTSSNFALLSKQEQDAKLYSYAALLNSLSFPIQILIQSKRVDISSYITQLEEDAQKTSNALLKTYIQQYKDFISELVKVNSVLDKSFYIVIPYTTLEQGAKGALKPSDLLASAKGALHTKASALQSQVDRLGLRSKILDKEELIRLFYSIYNDGLLQTQDTEDLKAPIVRTIQQP